ncbi:DUF1850 domain-containing protein [Natronococcus sp. A-GB7]|uniref:DUF1850 domain-containing protein n=1 Tax=Natronococcus sp. A-GB7 TaxID=3037649 RepID=UPI00241E057A|nr:DUF1850 domain-containing protein [Natronococcus sp. A-GB7]MDG5817883.1 DUF1850 domain-containing protein [Natronococcus sp. A-GB7]
MDRHPTTVKLTRRRLVASAFALFGASAVTISSATADRTLVVADAATEERLLELPVDDGERVTLEYTHSVERTPVEDVYAVDGDELRAVKSVFHSFGAGLPTDVTRTDEGYVVDGTSRHDELYVVPGSIAGHELVVGDDRYDLVGIADGGVVLFLTDRTAGDAFAADRLSSVVTPQPRGSSLEHKSTD